MPINNLLHTVGILLYHSYSEISLNTLFFLSRIIFKVDLKRIGQVKLGGVGGGGGGGGGGSGFPDAS